MLSCLLQSTFVAYCKLVATFGTAACKYFAAVCRLHTLTKAMHIFAPTIGWLECTFHNLLTFSLLDGSK